MLTNVPCFLWKKAFIHSFHLNHQTELERTLDVIQANPLIFQRRNQRLEAVKEAQEGTPQLCWGSITQPQVGTFQDYE